MQYIPCNDHLELPVDTNIIPIENIENELTVDNGFRAFAMNKSCRYLCMGSGT